LVRLARMGSIISSRSRSESTRPTQTADLIICHARCVAHVSAQRGCLDRQGDPALELV
jgi:hypothetical protein